MKLLHLKLASILFSCLFLFLLCEIGLRFFPYNSGMMASFVDDSQPVYRFLPDRDIQYSQDWDFKNGRIRHINKEGFLSDIEYDAKSSKPLLAVVGDSFVEAVHVDWDHSLHGYLHAASTPNTRVYAFGAAYAALAQYLSWAQYAHETYRPDMLVVNIVGNDFLQKLQIGNTPITGGFQGMTFFALGEDGELVLERTNRPKESLLKSLLRKSAVVNYMYRNLNVTSIPKHLSSLISSFTQQAQPSYVANTEAQVSAEDLDLSKREVDAFLKLLPQMSGLDADHIVITIDALRPDIYDPKKLAAVQDTFPAIMSKYLARKGSSLGFEVVALEPFFIKTHERTGEIFEFPFNGHWNASGHRVMAEAVLASQTYTRISRPNHPH